MKNYLKIQSVGEIETGAFTLIGASTKRDDTTKIGYYGSGLKYSISALIRNNIGFRVFSGKREVLITTKTHQFRNDSFEMIMVDGQATSLTTNMGGSDWDKPFAPIREIYSNALDEDQDATLGSSSDVYGDEGATTFYIEMTDNVKHFYDNVRLYFCNQNERVLAVNQHAAAYNPEKDRSLRLFRKNILCYHDENEKCLFNYNGDFMINESRVLSSEWMALRTVGNFWKEMTDKSMIKALIDGMKGGNDGLWEHRLEWDSYTAEFSVEWFEVCRNMKFVPAELVMFADKEDLIGRIILPKSLLTRLFRTFPELDVLGLSESSNDAKFLTTKNVSKILVDKVLDAISLLNKTRYVHRMEGLDIHYVTFTDIKILGYANDSKIYLSTKLDTYDVNAIAKIIIEENEHNKTGFHDETRVFQDHLFNLYFEELNA